MSNVSDNILVLPTAPLKEGVLFPGMETKMVFTREISLLALKEAKKSKNLIFITTQKNAELDLPTSKDLHEIGIVAQIKKIEKVNDHLSVSILALNRAKVAKWQSEDLLLIATLENLTDINDLPIEKLEVMKNHLLNSFKKLINFGSLESGVSFISFLSSLSPGQTCDHIANMLTSNNKIKQKILEALKVSQRLKLTLVQVETELQIAKVETDVIKKTHEKFEKNLRENVLRERLQMIQKELGEADDDEVLADEYAQKLKKIKTTTENKEKITKELKRYRQTSSMSPESGYLRNWLDVVFELPWNKNSRDNLDLQRAEKILNETHYGLDEVKDRILEYMAVMQLRSQQKKASRTPTILCFVGPPGVGKTSIGQSIAKALGRKFAKISLGGVRDEAEIRGHRRTYVGAMVGRIIAGIKQAKTSNPVFMLDEIDKLANDYKGDPASALLEVLDPEQNHNFEDHYLDMPFDLSQVMFIATANTLDIPKPLLDRMEIIRYAGYTRDEKLQIAKKYLLKKSINENGLKTTQISLNKNILSHICEFYTKEAGVREFSRQLDKIMRKVARQLLIQTNLKKVIIDEKNLIEYLGPAKYDVSLKNQSNEIGVATGLAWTSVGGDVLFVEVTSYPGKGELKLTGQLGEVMKESAQAALTFVRSKASELKIDLKILEKTDLHVHVPEGAVPKDGPSAGVTIVTALVSALTNRAVKKEVAMTGEVTLRGKVLRIGGLKEKAIAAARAGCHTICIPWDNQRDLIDLPTEITKQIKFKPTKNVLENLHIALEK